MDPGCPPLGVPQRGPPSPHSATWPLTTSAAYLGGEPQLLPRLRELQRAGLQLLLRSDFSTCSSCTWALRSSMLMRASARSCKKPQHSTASLATGLGVGQDTDSFVSPRDCLPSRAQGTAFPGEAGGGVPLERPGKAFPWRNRGLTAESCADLCLSLVVLSFSLASSSPSSLQLSPRCAECARGPPPWPGHRASKNNFFPSRGLNRRQTRGNFSL